MVNESAFTTETVVKLHIGIPQPRGKVEATIPPPSFPSLATNLEAGERDIGAGNNSEEQLFWLLATAIVSSQEGEVTTEG